MKKKERELFINNLNSMNKHFLETQSKDKIGKYWYSYIFIIMKQVEIMKGDIFSPNWYFANTFGGGALNGIKDLKNKIETSKKYKFVRILYSPLVRFFKRTTLANFLWRYVFSKRMLWAYAKSASNNYDNLVICTYYLLEEKIKKYNLSSPDIFGIDLVEVDGRKLAYKTLRYFKMFLHILNLNVSKFDTVVEIGAGIGELARIFLTTGTARKYIIVDIPPALAFSQYFLSTVLPEEKIEFFKPDRTTIDPSGDWMCCFLTPDQLAYIPKFDLGINSSSFGEMTQNIVSKYINELKKKDFQEFVSINHRIFKPGNKEKIGEKEYIEYFGPEYKVKSKYSWGEGRLDLKILEDKPGMQGYQLLHFVKK